MVYWKITFLRIVNNFLALLLCKMDLLDISNIVDFFKDFCWTQKLISFIQKTHGLVFSIHRVVFVQ